MFNLTDAAAAHLSVILGQTQASDEQAVRMIPTQQGLELTLDAPKPDDQTFAHEGKTVLVIEPKLATMLENRTLDVETGDDGTHLTLQ